MGSRDHGVARARVRLGTRSRLAGAGAVILLTLTVTGCGTRYGRSEDSGLAFTPSLSDLHGKAWVTDAVIDPHHTLVPGSSITVKFTEHSLSANAGCNTLFGAATVHDTKLVAAQLASTQIGCPKPLAAQDVWLAAFLGSHPTIERLDENLWLSHKDTVVHLTQQG